ncbi:hypothetical protein DS745_03750 [Anaerobacillus alkaliphilus]|uniref:Uncharacterized protein n=1 Tax=Anaerobacillus alkaliphilus TaxID=1548597 RepID=A0A4Q0VXP2_9BACI|nr:hypothetical protein [Anaerobacillus alkaliphilus]RXJ04507.1 hypothetical protein DS745_03750 [Anaerobacillus alkaliphilus]
MEKSRYFRNFIILFLIIIGSPIVLYFYATVYGTTFSVSPLIIVNGEKINYTGIIIRRMGDTPTDPVVLAQNIILDEPNVVKANSTIEVFFVDKPSKVFLEKWFDGEIIEKWKVTKKEEINITTPAEEGNYVYKLNPRWDFRDRVDIVFEIEVKH